MRENFCAICAFCVTKTKCLCEIIQPSGVWIRVTQKSQKSRKEKYSCEKFSVLSVLSVWNNKTIRRVGKGHTEITEITEREVFIREIFCAFCAFCVTKTKCLCEIIQPSGVWVRVTQKSQKSRKLAVRCASVLSVLSVWNNTTIRRVGKGHTEITEITEREVFIRENFCAICAICVTKTKCLCEINANRWVGKGYTEITEIKRIMQL